MHKQMAMSPYYGVPDFSVLGEASARIDPVSVADVLRNAFVYPPHSILADVKLATFGFFPHHDMHAEPTFRYRFRDSGKRKTSPHTTEELVEGYHRLLCQAIEKSCAGMRAPWLLQSGGKDSTTIAIALAEARPDAGCMTYLGGKEENELQSAATVAKELGLRHEMLVCNPRRAYHRYLAIVERMPLLTADFALLSYVDLATEIAGNAGDGVIDGMGSDSYFGAPAQKKKQLLFQLANGIRLPRITEWPLVKKSFAACYLLGSMQMHPIERIFPGSRFTDSEVDEIFGQPLAAQSRARMTPFQEEIATAQSHDELRVISMSISAAAAAFAKGLYTAPALGMQVAYPLCDEQLREWVYREVPVDLLIDPVERKNKVLVRKHIARRFQDLPYVQSKGSFRFDLKGLARDCFDEVYEMAKQVHSCMPGAAPWLLRNRANFGNKYHASKFYLLAVVLPWVLAKGHGVSLEAFQHAPQAIASPMQVEEQVSQLA